MLGGHLGLTEEVLQPPQLFWLFLPTCHLPNVSLSLSCTSLLFSFPFSPHHLPLLHCHQIISQGAHASLPLAAENHSHEHFAEDSSVQLQVAAQTQLVQFKNRIFGQSPLRPCSANQICWAALHGAQYLQLALRDSLCHVVLSAKYKNSSSDHYILTSTKKITEGIWDPDFTNVHGPNAVRQWVLDDKKLRNYYRCYCNLFSFLFFLRGWTIFLREENQSVCSISRGVHPTQWWCYLCLEPLWKKNCHIVWLCVPCCGSP